MTGKRRKTIRRVGCAALILVLLMTGIMIVPKIVRYLTLKPGKYDYVLLADSTAEIREYHGMESAVDIPDMLDGHSVSRIGDHAFSWRILLRNVTVPKGIEEIGSSAFAGCNNLRSVKLPDGIKIIGDNAFSECGNLAEVQIPQSVISIGRWAFSGCHSLSGITIPDGATDVGANPFANCRRLEQVTCSPVHPTLEAVDGSLYSRDGTVLMRGNPFASTFIVPHDVQTIGDSAFYMADRLTEVTIPAGVSTIQEHAFDGCSALTHVRFSEGLGSIGNVAFSECTSLTEVELPDGLKEIGYLAFYGCTGLTQVRIPPSIEEIGDGAFIGCSELMLIVEAGSFAEDYCIQNDLPFKLKNGQ